MELDYFSDELGRIFYSPESVTLRKGAEFASRLSRFLHQESFGRPSQLASTLWCVPADGSGALCPHAQFMLKLEQVLTLGLDQMCQSLLDSFSREDGSRHDEGSLWQTLGEQVLQPMSRLCRFARVLRACMSPMRQWLDTGVFIGHRSLCPEDQIRQFCLDQFLKPAAPVVSRAVFIMLHSSQRDWSAGELEPVIQYIGILHQYQRFQSYLSHAGYLTGPFNSWEEVVREGKPGSEQQVFEVRRAFTEPYLASLREFYRPFLQPFDAGRVAKSVCDWRAKEEHLAGEFGIAGFSDSAVNCMLELAVKNNLETFGAAARQLMEQGDWQGLSLFFQVMTMVEGGLEHLLEVLRDFVRSRMLQMFDSIRLEFESLDPNSAKATSTYIDGCIAQMRYCKAMIDATEPRQPLSRNLLLGTVKTGIADVFNTNPLIDAIRHPASYPAAALAHHFHRKMRSFRTLDSESRDVICDLMTLYSLLVDKEAFLMRYHSLLRERLLSEGCDHLSLDAENFALENFTELSGWKAVYEVKSVLKDFKESEEFNAQLRNRPEFQAAQRTLFGGLVPVKFTFVRGYFWRMGAETASLPPDLAPIVDLALSAYQANHTGRAVTFACSYGSGLLAFSPTPRQAVTQQPQQQEQQQQEQQQQQQQQLAGSDGEVLLRCSTAVMILLLNFNGTDGSLTGSALQERTGIRQADVTFYLSHLVRTGLLLATGDLGDSYAVNGDFRSTSKLVNLMVSQQQHSQKHQRRLEKLDQRLKEKRVQCAVVAVMKQLRQLTRGQLFQMVQSRLPDFVLNTSFFAEQLTYLISTGYVRVATDVSDDTGESLLEYVP